MPAADDFRDFSLLEDADDLVMLPTQEEWLAAGAPMEEVCPRCGHTDQQHDEAGCYVCGCTGP